MSDEVDKRVMEAAEALVTAFEALREARQSLDDPRLNSAQDAQRNQGFSQAGSRMETGVRRAEEALRKAFVAAAVDRDAATFTGYRLADERLTKARAELRGAGRESEASGRVTRLSVCAAMIDQGLDATKDLIFNRPAAGCSAPDARHPQHDEATFSPVLSAPGGGGTLPAP